MADVIEIVTDAPTVLEVGTVGPQGIPGIVGATGPKGDKGDPGTGIETLTTKGDLLTRDDNGAARVGIGSEGQVLKVANTGLPAWQNESGGVADNDPRLSDPRDPNAHAASHQAGEADELFDQNLSTTDTPTFTGLTIEGTAVAGQTPDTVLRGGAWFGAGDSSSGVAIYKDGDSSVLKFEGVNEAVSAYVPLQFAASGSPQLYLATDENVGIGTTGPTEKLDVAGNIAIRDLDNENAATFDAQSNLTDNRTYDLPDADGTLVLDSQLGTVATSNSYNDLDDLPTLGTAATQDSTAFDASGTAASAVSTHAGKTDGTAHSISGISGLQSALDGKAASSHTHPDATTTVAGFLSASDKTKIDGIASGATSNSSDATLLARANHTGTQAASTITGLAAIATSGSASDLGSGTVPIARLGASGTPSGNTYLAGDNSWKAVTAGVSAMQSIAINFVLN